MQLSCRDVMCLPRVERCISKYYDTMTVHIGDTARLNHDRYSVGAPMDTLTTQSVNRYSNDGVEQ